MQMKSSEKVLAVRKFYATKNGRSIKATAEYHSLAGQSPYFAITGVYFENGVDVCHGCCHEYIHEFLPEVRHMIKWHGLHGGGWGEAANAMYHASDVGIEHWHVHGKTELPIIGEIKFHKMVGTAEKDAIVSMYPDCEIKGSDIGVHPANLEYARKALRLDRGTLEQFRDKNWVESKVDPMLIRFNMEMRNFFGIPTTYDEARKILEVIKAHEEINGKKYDHKVYWPQ